MKLFRLSLSAILFNLFIPQLLPAQNTENPGEYMTALANARGDMDGKYMQYMSAAAHGRGARRVEKLRQQVLESITQSRYKTIDLPKFKGDNSLRQSSIDYIQMCYRVFNEDFQKIVDMEELAEQSIDEMQAFLLLQEKVSERLQVAADSLYKATNNFAAKYKVNLIDQKSALGQKMEAAGNLNEYSNDVFIQFFKCNWQDSKMVEAMNNKKVNEIEQTRNALIQYANEGLKALDTLRTFNNDPTLSNACRQVLTYYKNAAEKEIPKLTDFYLKQENFDKMKKDFEGKPQSQRTQKDVDTYNKSIKDINDAINKYNQTNNVVNSGRTKVLNDWTAAQKKFSDTHMPYYR
jgi:predicted DNA-binding protein